MRAIYPFAGLPRLKAGWIAGKCVAPGLADPFSQVQRTFEINVTLVGRLACIKDSL
jgi:hypothetical protein